MGLRHASIRVVVALWIPPELKPGVSALDEALRQARLLRQLARDATDFVVARSAAHARSILAAERIALVPAIEGGHGIRSVDDVDRLYAAGVRIVGLVQFTDNQLAEAREHQLGPLGSLFENARGGLSPLGAAVVRRMAREGMIVDVSHASARTTNDVLDIAEEEGVVVIASHEGSARGSGRSVGDAEAARIARLGRARRRGHLPKPARRPGPRARALARVRGGQLRRRGRALAPLPRDHRR